MFAAEAMAVEDKDRAAALDLANRAHRLDPSLVPAALVAARVHIANGSPRKAQRIIRDTWALSPHPDLADVLAHQKPGDSADTQFERVRDLVREHAGGLEGAYSLARAAVRAKRWDVARDALKPYIDDRPQARICALMADIEEAQDDKGRAREWLARALRAPRDPMWVSDGVASLKWTPISPVSGEIVPCEWKQPFDMPEQLEPDAEPAPEPLPETPAPPKAIEAPQRVIPQHQPDDPGLPEDLDGTAKKSSPLSG